MNIAEIKKRIAFEIKTSGISQCEIARKIGVHPTAITQYLSGRSAPALDTLAKLCVVLDISADYVLGITDYTGQSSREDKKN